MKKKIGFVPMDPALGAWLLEMLAKHPPESENAAELCSGVQELLCGELEKLQGQIQERETYLAAYQQFDKTIQQMKKQLAQTDSSH